MMIVAMARAHTIETVMLYTRMLINLCGSQLFSFNFVSPLVIMERS